MDQKLVSVKINGEYYDLPEGITIYKACKDIGIEIPTLCYLEGVNEEGACSVCLVEVKGAKTLLRSCVSKISEHMEICTNSERVRQARRINIELLLASHPADCQTCERNQNCRLRLLAYDMGVKDIRFSKKPSLKPAKDFSSPSLVRDPDKCILCERCIAVCSKIQTVNAINLTGRGKQTRVSTFFDKGLAHSTCINCGQCLLVCPTGAIVEKDSIEDVWKAIGDQKKVVVVQTAPAVRIALGEEFGMSEGSLVTGKMVAALRRLGFAKVFDTQFTADLTIIEEGTELLRRLKTKGRLPMITSCSPGWIRFAELFYPKALPHISTCKSPQQMFGAVTKTYYAEKMNIDPEDIVVVSIMPCTAKKYEAQRPEMINAFTYWQHKNKLKNKEVFPDVDYVLTTREAARMIKEAGVNFNLLKEESFDDPLGESSGAGTIFGVTGGVMEAALRTVYEIVTGSEVPFNKLNILPVRGFSYMRRVEIPIQKTVGEWKFLEGATLKLMVGHTIGSAREIMEMLSKGELNDYHFIEIMTCPGGCLGGGGQPISNDPLAAKERRKESVYKEDEGLPYRKSHDNPSVKAIYKEFLKDGPCGHLSHELLHTRYNSLANKKI